MTCMECGLEMEVDEIGVSRHLGGGLYGDSFDADADHDAYENDGGRL